MLFFKKNFSQFFSVRPSRRGTGYALPAEVQTLQSKVLLSAVPAEVEDPTTEEDLTAEDPTTTEDPMTAEDPTTEEDPMTDEDPMTEEPGTEEDDPATETDDTTTDEGQVPVFVGTVTIEVINGSVTITGEVLVPDGSSPTITFGGALSGLSATIGADGSFTLTASSSTTGVGTISLLDDDGFMVDFQTVLL